MWHTGCWIPEVRLACRIRRAASLWGGKPPLVPSTPLQTKEHFRITAAHYQWPLQRLTAICPSLRNSLNLTYCSAKKMSKKGARCKDFSWYLKNELLKLKVEKWKLLELGLLKIRQTACVFQRVYSKVTEKFLTQYKHDSARFHLMILIKKLISYWNCNGEIIDMNSAEATKFVTNGSGTFGNGSVY